MNDLRLLVCQLATYTKKKLIIMAEVIEYYRIRHPGTLRHRVSVYGEILLVHRALLYVYLRLAT